MEQHMQNLGQPKRLGKAGGNPPKKAPPAAPKEKTGLKHFVTLTRAGRPLHYIPSHVTRVRSMVPQDGHQTDIQDRSGRTQVAEPLQVVLDTLGRSINTCWLVISLTLCSSLASCSKISLHNWPLVNPARWRFGDG